MKLVKLISILFCFNSFANDHLIDINALPLLLPDTDISTEYQYSILPWMTLGPRLTYNTGGDSAISVGSTDNTQTSYYTAGLATYVYFNNWYTNLNLSYLKVEHTSNIEEKTGDGLLYSIGGGYHWGWETFSLKLGATLAKTTLDYETLHIKTSANGSGSAEFNIANKDSFELDIEARVGWLF